jgi:glycosyltransferase involved in cell wall biosynthesis
MRVGVVIRTLDEGAWIRRCVEVLRGQRGEFDLDIVVVDSGSTDGTVEIARELAVQVVEIPPASFDYSRALNMGIAATSGELVASLSAHAIPVDDLWLEHMAAPFADPRVAGVASRQVPWPDAPWQEVRRLAETFGDEPVVYDISGIDRVVFSNAASMIRRAVWAESPFTLPSVEDLDWARRSLAAGRLIAYEPRAAVSHSHREAPRAQAHRLIDINRVSGGARRTRLRTLREGLGLLVRDGRAIASLDVPLAQKPVYLWDLARVAFYYVTDFERSGTVAEWRRAGG